MLTTKIADGLLFVNPSEVSLYVVYMAWSCFSIAVFTLHVPSSKKLHQAHLMLNPIHRKERKHLSVSLHERKYLLTE